MYTKITLGLGSVTCGADKLFKDGVVLYTMNPLKEVLD